MGVGAGLYMCDVVKKFTFAISSPDEFLSYLVSNSGLLFLHVAGSTFRRFTHFQPKKEHFSSYDLELWPMLLTYEHDLGRVAVNHQSITPNIQVNGRFVGQLSCKMRRAERNMRTKS